MKTTMHVVIQMLALLMVSAFASAGDSSEYEHHQPYPEFNLGGSTHRTKAIPLQTHPRASTENAHYAAAQDSFLNAQCNEKSKRCEVHHEGNYYSSYPCEECNIIEGYSSGQCGVKLEGSEFPDFIHYCCYYCDAEDEAHIHVVNTNVNPFSSVVKKLLSFLPLALTSAMLMDCIYARSDLDDE